MERLNLNGGIYTLVRRERREVVGDTVLAGEAYRIVRVLTGPGDAVAWTPAARCAVRVDRSPETPVIEWVPVTGACAPLEQGMPLSGVESGSFEATVVGDTVAFSTGIRGPDPLGGWRFAEGIGPHRVWVYLGSSTYETTVMTYVRTDDVEAGRAYEPGWWHYLVRLEPGDHYQYEEYDYGIGYSMTTFEEWVVRGDTVVSDTARVLVEQNEYAEDGVSPVRQSLCGVAKGVGGVSTVTLQGAPCHRIGTGEIWWFQRLRNVEAFDDVYPGSYTQYGYPGGSHYTFVAVAEGIGYVRSEAAYRPGTMGSAYGGSFTLRYAVVGGIEYGSPVVAGEPEPTAVRPSVRAYPNPFRTALSINVAGTRPAVAEVEVLDALGRRVLGTAVAVPGTHRLDLSALPPGMYVVRTALEDGTVLTRRVTKVR